MTREELLERVVVDPNVCFGKPVIRGTRIWVAVIVENLAEGLSVDQIVADYPGLTALDVRAALAYAAETLSGGGQIVDFGPDLTNVEPWKLRPARIKLQPLGPRPSTRVVHELLRSGGFELPREALLGAVREGHPLFTRPTGFGRVKEWLIANKSLLEPFEWTVETLGDDGAWVPAPEHPEI